VRSAASASRSVVGPHHHATGIDRDHGQPGRDNLAAPVIPVTTTRTGAAASHRRSSSAC
jgi:hypothetical protein